MWCFLILQNENLNNCYRRRFSFRLGIESKDYDTWRQYAY